MNWAIQILLILGIGSFASIISQRFRIAYAELLIVIGVIIAILKHLLNVPLEEFSSEFIITIVLPPLIFYAALTMRQSLFKKVRKTIILLSIIGVIISAILCSAILTAITTLPWAATIVLGVILAPTDAASVIHAIQRVKAHRKLTAIIEGEALFNDATVLALFSAVTITFDPLFDVLKIITGFIGGGLIGFITAFLVNKIIHLNEDKMAEVMMTIMTAYGSYMLANSLGLSGIIAVAVLGLYVGNYYERTGIKDPKNFIIRFWNLAAFVANTIAFIFIGLGLEVATFGKYLPFIGLTFIAMLLARLISIHTVIVTTSRFISPLSRSQTNIIWLGGVKGAVSAALALSLPSSNFRNIIVAITFGAILLSLIVQTRLFSFYVEKRWSGTSAYVKSRRLMSKLLSRARQH